MGLRISRLQVIQTHLVLIVDLSICPGNVGSNTYSTALMIGEKAAVIIAEELEIK
jgi:alcohol oxidase